MPFFAAGVDVTRNNLAFVLAEKNYQVLCLGHFSGTQALDVTAMASYIAYLNEWNIKWKLVDQCELHYQYKGVACIVTFEEKFYSLLDKIVEKNDVVFVLNKQSAKMVEAMNLKGAVTVAWVTDAVAERKSLYKANPQYLLYNSQAMADFGAQFHNREFHILNSPFLRPEKVVPYQYKQNVITLINPIEKKGVETFLQLSERLPNYLFYAVESWRSVSLGEKYLQKNVRYFHRQLDMTPIYNATKILLYPSHFNEGPGRAVIEAGLHGVPSIVSNNGSLPDALGGGGVVLKTFDVQDWLQAILDLENNYAKFSYEAMLSAQRYQIDFEKELQRIGVL